MEPRRAIRQRHVVDAVFDFPSIAVVLPLDPGGVIAALGRSGLIDAADRLRSCVLAGHDLLAVVTQLLFIPNNGLQEPLQGSGRDALIQGDGFDVLALEAREQSAHVRLQQRASLRPSEAGGKARQELGEQPAEFCDILNGHGTTLRGFLVKQIDTRRVVSFAASCQEQ